MRLGSKNDDQGLTVTRHYADRPLLMRWKRKVAIARRPSDIVSSPSAAEIRDSGSRT